jgi:hypothetical protein
MEQSFQLGVKLVEIRPQGSNLGDLGMFAPFSIFILLFLT